MVKRRRMVAGIVIALVALTLACGEATTPGAGLPGATPAAPVMTSSALQPTIEAAQVELYLSEIQAMDAAREAQTTLQAVYAQQTATAQSVQATATARSWEATATADALVWQATATAWQTTVEAQQVQATATAQAQAVYATATARAEERQEQLAAMQWSATATADARAFDLAIQTTAIAVEATATAVAERAAAEEALYNEQVRRAQLDTQAAELSYPVRAYGPWLILLLGVGVVLWLIINLGRAEAIRRSVIERDARGDAPIIVTRQRRQLTYYDPDRSLGPILTVDDEGQASAPPVAPLEYQAQVTARDQAIDLAHRGALTGPSGSRRALPGSQAAEFGPAQPTGIRLVPASQLREWLADVTPKALTAALGE